MPVRQDQLVALLILLTGEALLFELLLPAQILPLRYCLRLWQYAENRQQRSVGRFPVAFAVSGTLLTAFGYFAMVLAG